MVYGIMNLKKKAENAFRFAHPTGFLSFEPQLLE